MRETYLLRSNRTTDAPIVVDEPEKKFNLIRVSVIVIYDHLIIYEKNLAMCSFSDNGNRK